MAGISEQAVVDPKAKIGPGVTVGPFCLVGPDVTLEEGVVLRSHVSVEGHTSIGASTEIWPFASIGAAPQDLKYAGEPTRLAIGRENTIRESTTINRGTVGGGGITTIGDGNLLMAYAHVGHDCHIGDRNIFANGATLAGHVEVGSDATIGASSGVHQFCRVANFAFIGGYSVVTQDAMPWVTIVGNRAKAYGLNAVGLKRRGYSPETVKALKHCYKTLFRSKLRLDEALEKMAAETSLPPEVLYFLDFVKTSERGVVR